MLSTRFWTLVLVLLWLTGLPVQAQQVTEDPEVKPQSQALNVGAHLHTYGIGVDIQYTVRPPQYERYELMLNVSLASFKDRDEGRIVSVYANQGGRNFIWEKQNYAYFLSPTVGAQYVLIERSEFNRVQVKAGLSVGPSIALLKPYLVDIAVRIPSAPGFVAPQPVVFDPINRSSFLNRPMVYSDVIGESEFTQGFDRISARYGGRIRADFTVDLSGSSYFVRAIHLGVQMDMFPRQLPIMVRDNQQTFIGAFAGFVVGSAW